MKKTAKEWKTVNQLAREGWDFSKECLSHLSDETQRTIIRTNGTEFAIMKMGGPLAGHLPTMKIVKTFENLDAARAYHFAMYR